MNTQQTTAEEKLPEVTAEEKLPEETIMEDKIAGNNMEEDTSRSTSESSKTISEAVNATGIELKTATGIEPENISENEPEIATGIEPAENSTTPENIQKQTVMTEVADLETQDNNADETWGLGWTLPGTYTCLLYTSPSPRD